MDVQVWLEEFAEVHSRFELMCSRYEAMKASLEAPRSAAPDGMPRSGGNPVDTIGNGLARLETLREQIEKVSELEQRLYDERDAAIDRITGKKAALMQTILRYRHLDLMGWREIVSRIFDIDADTADNFDSKLRLVHDYHKRGREALRKILER